jgi:hypothetical protein
MAQYHDMNYVNYVLNLSACEGFDLYLKCLDRFNGIRLWEMFLVNASNGYDKSFEEYKKEVTSQVKTKTMSKEEKELESERIIKKTQKIIELDRKRRLASEE